MLKYEAAQERKLAMKNIMFLPAACAAAFIAGCATVAEPAYDTLIAHRGESKDAPENTLPAYRMAVDRGFGFECDIYLSSDKRVFSFHDTNLKRTTGVDMPCTKASWVDLVSKVDAGAWKGEQWKGTRPALLEEILELARDGRQIYIEVKGDATDIVPYIKEILAKQKTATPKNVLFITFSKNICRAIKAQMPEYRVYWLTGAVNRQKQPISAEEIVATLKELGVDGVDQHFKPDVVTADYIAAIRSAGFEYHSWTIDTLDNACLAFSRGAQTVTTNCAKKLLDEYKSTK